MSTSVKAWVEEVILPTYPIGKVDPNPLFLEKRVYQGSSGSVYPYGVIDSISDDKIDQSYQAVFIENDYIKIMLLPELGGRIHRAYDKMKGRDFVYYNEVVKPALVGLLGPWISGELNSTGHSITVQPLSWRQILRLSTITMVQSRYGWVKSSICTVCKSWLVSNCTPTKH